MNAKHSMLTAALLLAAGTLAANPVQASLLVHYTGDLTGSQFLDSSGNANHGTQDGTNQETNPAFVKIGPNAMKINGSSTSVDVAAGNPDFNRTYTEFSLSLWVNPGSNEHNVNRYYAGKMAGSGNRGWQLARNTNQTMAFLYFDGPNGTQQVINSGTSVPAGTFTHVAVTYAADDFLRMYLDGQLVTEMTESQDNILSLLNGVNSALFQVGNRGDNISSSNSGSTGARIDDFGLWDVALTTAQIEQIYFWGNQGLNLQQALAVPEPGAYALGLLGGLGAALLVWRRRKGL